ncbi:hypothetical protein BE11_15535 [Sorangium cellulosum]|nr:hypothetical protein BE11_15535 [Sorangium cellulosum]
MGAGAAADSIAEGERSERAHALVRTTAERRATDRLARGRLRRGQRLQGMRGERRAAGDLTPGDERPPS